MAQIVEKKKKEERLQYRFFISNKGDDKKLRALLWNHGHTQTHRDDLDFDAAIFYTSNDEKSIVAPLLYGAKAISGIKLNLDLDREWLARYHDLAPNFPKIGIGRGAHFLNIMSGGGMWQKVIGHHTSTLHHDIKMYDTGELVVAPSMHDQLMTCGSHGTVLAWANATVKHEDDTEVVEEPNNWYDPEIIYYEHTNSLCVEPRPEILGYNKYTEVFMNLVQDAICPAISPPL